MLREARMCHSFVNNKRAHTAATYARASCVNKPNVRAGLQLHVTDGMLLKALFESYVAVEINNMLITANRTRFQKF